ncbi:MAG: DUF2066 domain-containing protein [Proteobacteria bacterium]|nr:DUF2066 domain-containing protein [Pseudomonadota bacterium]
MKYGTVLLKRVFIGLLLTLNFAWANNFDANQTSILAKDTNANDPLKFTQAFAQIIANNTGEKITTILNNSVFATANIQAGLKRSYFEKIDYKLLPENSSYKFWFSLVMREDFVKNTIKQAGFSVLPNNPEAIMLWLVASQDVLEDGQLPSQSLNYAYDDEVLMYWLNHWSVALGLNIKSPTLDDNDKTAVPSSAIKNLSFEAHQQSQSRYDTNQSLLIYLQQKPSYIKIRSGYNIADNDMAINHFQENTDDLGVALYSVLADVKQKYANKNKIDSAAIQHHAVQLVINSLANYDEVNTAIKYLTKLSVIESFNIVYASIGRVVITANLSVSSAAFTQIVMRDQILSQSSETSINQLVFEYRNIH